MSDAEAHRAGCPACDYDLNHHGDGKCYTYADLARMREEREAE